MQVKLNTRSYSRIASPPVLLETPRVGLSIVPTPRTIDHWPRSPRHGTPKRVALGAGDQGIKEGEPIARAMTWPVATRTFCSQEIFSTYPTRSIPTKRTTLFAAPMGHSRVLQTPRQQMQGNVTGQAFLAKSQGYINHVVGNCDEVLLGSFVSDHITSGVGMHLEPPPRQPIGVPVPPVVSQ